jgi:hypothetical protein
VAEADGFLGRWARRKNMARDGQPLDEPKAEVSQALEPQPPRAKIPGAQVAAQPPVSPADAPATAEPPKPLTLEDVQALTKESDYGPFVARAVEPGVRNAAMKKLFSDPHFNVMDRLDIYIDDYSQPDPIPASMMRKLASAKFLGLFDEEEKAEAKALAEQAQAAQAPSNDALSADTGPADADGTSSANEGDIASTRETAHTGEPVSVAQSAPAQALSEPGAASAMPDPSFEIEPHPAPQSEALMVSRLAQEEHAHTDLRLQPDDAAPAEKAGRIAE